MCVSTAVWNESNGAVRPLDDKQEERVLSSWEQLIECIEWDGGLLAELFKESCLTLLQKMSIEELQKADRNKRLMKIMTHKSVAEFTKFLSCLAETGQHHLVALLTTDSGLLFILFPYSRLCNIVLSTNSAVTYGVMFSSHMAFHHLIYFHCSW